MIKTIQLSRLFRTEEMETKALDQINLSVKPGEFLAIMGPSGCGKSTLLNILGLLDIPSEGEYYFNGEEVSRYNESRRTELRRGKIGFIFQNYNLVESLTVHENVELPLYYSGIRSAERSKRVKEMLERMRMSHRRKHFPRQLSGGQQQRVAIARAVITKPALVLADEPTGNLDSLNGEEVMKLLEELNLEGTSLIMVTHAHHYAARAHRCLHMLDGRLENEERNTIIS